MARDTKKKEEASSPVSTGLRALIFLGLALVAGAAATIMVYQMIQGYEARIQQAQKPEEMAIVIVAAGDLYPGLTITEQDIVGVEVPKKYLPADAFNSADLVVGRIPRERILANEFVRPGRLADGDAGIGLNALVPPGMRALSVNLSNGAALSGFLQPGNRVDILCTLTDPETSKVETLTLLQTIPIIAVNAKMLKEEEPDPAEKKGAKKKKPPRQRPSITLAVTPEQAEMIAHGEKIGKLVLTLRNDVDLVHEDMAGVNTNDLLGIKPPEPSKVKSPIREKPKTSEGVTLEIIRGGQKQTKTYTGEAAKAP